MTTPISGRSSAGSISNPELDPTDAPVAPKGPISVAARDEVQVALAEMSVGEESLGTLLRSMHENERLEVSLGGGAEVDGLVTEGERKASIQRLADGGYEVKLGEKFAGGFGDAHAKTTLASNDSSTWRMSSPEGAADLLQALIARSGSEQVQSSTLLGASGFDKVIDSMPGLRQFREAFAQRIAHWDANNLSAKGLGLSMATEGKTPELGPVHGKAGLSGATFASLDRSDPAKPKLKLETAVKLDAELKSSLEKSVRLGETGVEAKVAIKLVQEQPITPEQAARLAKGGNPLAAVDVSKLQSRIEIELEGAQSGHLTRFGSTDALAGSASFHVKTTVTADELSRLLGGDVGQLTAKQFDGEVALSGGADQTHLGFDTEHVQAKLDASRSHVTHFEKASLADVLGVMQQSNADQQHVEAMKATARH